ncbi:MAG: hypothetical protein R3C25_13635 [Hyphomonadaceae bacterium]
MTWNVGSSARWRANVAGVVRGRVGVWVERKKGRAGPAKDKIAAIGVRLRKWVSFHGIAFNVEPGSNTSRALLAGISAAQNLASPAWWISVLPVTMADADAALRFVQEIFGDTIIAARRKLIHTRHFAGQRLCVSGFAVVSSHEEAQGAPQAARWEEECGVCLKRALRGSFITTGGSARRSMSAPAAATFQARQAWQLDRRGLLPLVGSPDRARDAGVPDAS